MATYIPGITDYIPQYQPFQPDYNFLGNMLQNAQSKYDANYKQLSKTYGTLLNSPMLREDNIQQRDEFFKMIDGDIKRISGMDLSLQQNVDAANSVFDSFYQNKEMVKDMVFTKEYQKQLEIGDNYRNCIDQEKCGGKYWDVGAQALHYRADEFKKANRQDTLTMSPGRFVPQINIEEKAMKYAQDLFGKSGNFGIQAMTKSPDGRYNITLKNGQLLQVPLQQLLLNQYGKDQNIIDMFNTSAYVNRKGYIAQNAERLGSDDAAEDEYFRLMDQEVIKARQALIDAQDLKNVTDLKRTKLEEKIRTNGSTGGDDLAFEYESTSADNVAASDALEYHKETSQVANSIFEAGDNRQMKRQRVDALFSRTSMTKQIGDSATMIAALTGSEEWEADPYAKSYYDFSLDMAKMEKQHVYNKDEAFYKTMLDLSKEQAIEDYKHRGSAVGPENNGVFDAGYLGTSSGEGTDDENKTIRDAVSNQTNVLESSSQKYVSGYANTLMTTIKDPNAAADEKRAAEEAMKLTFGYVKYDENGKAISGGWDRKKKVFVGSDNKEYTDPQVFVDRYSDWRGLYSNAKKWNRYFKDYDSQGAYLEGEGGALLKQFGVEQDEYNAINTLYKQNNENVRKYGHTSDAVAELSEGGSRSISSKQAWDQFFKDGRVQTRDQFVKSMVEMEKPKFHASTTQYVKGYGMDKGFTTGIPGYGESDVKAQAEKLYNDFHDVYKKIYNGGNSQGKDADGQPVPIVTAMHSNSAFGGYAGGKTSGAVIFNYNPDNGAALGTRGLTTFYNDALRGGSMFTMGNHPDMGTATMFQNDNARAAYEQLVLDIQSGKLTKEEQKYVGKVAYMDVALSDPKYTGIHVKFPQTFLDRYKGTKDNPTWADDQSLVTKGVGIYTEKNGATNDFTRAYATQPYDMVLNHSNKTITYGSAGSLTINKRAPDGSFTVTGSLFGYENGKKVPVRVEKIYGPGTGGQNLFNGIDTYMQQVNVINKSYENQSPLYFDPSQLPEIQKGLNQQAGDQIDMNMNDYFRNQFQLNMQSMQQLNM